MKVISLQLNQGKIHTEEKEFKTLRECMDSVGVCLTENRVKAISNKEKPFVIKTENNTFSYFLIDDDKNYEEFCNKKALKKLLKNE